MSRSRVLAVSLLALALLSGPAAAVCGACCPEASERAAALSAPACCGDCAPSLTQAPESAAVAAKKSVAGNGDPAALTGPAAPPLPAPTFSPAVSAAVPPSSFRRVCAAPLRL